MTYRPERENNTDPEKKAQDTNNQNVSNHLSFEDKLITLWTDYKSLIIKSIFGLLVAIVLIKGFDIYKQSRLKNAQTAFQAAYEKGTTEAKEEYAEDYSGFPMASVFLLEIADEAYRNDSFDKAIEYYSNAASSLKGTSLEARPLLGYATSLAKTDKTLEAEKIYSQILNNSNNLDSYRAEAAYQLAVLALKQHNIELARSYLKKIEDMTYAGYWAQKIMLLRISVPELSTDLTE